MVREGAKQGQQVPAVCQSRLTESLWNSPRCKCVRGSIGVTVKIRLIALAGSLRLHCRRRFAGERDDSGATRRARSTGVTDREPGAIKCKKYLIYPLRPTPGGAFFYGSPDSGVGANFAIWRRPRDLRPTWTKGSAHAVQDSCYRAPHFSNKSAGSGLCFSTTASHRRS